MEIEKTRETSWKIQLKNKNESIELTSVEVSGEVRILKLTLLKNSDSLVVEMKKDEFFNFLSLISAFRDVIIGEEQFDITEHTDSNDLTLEITPKAEKNDYYRKKPKIEEKTLDDEESPELNPEEWDPW
ncbi:MAG: hypothetical protein ACFFE5_15025 [Candidatus Thorarchaeota archaeon]